MDPLMSDSHKIPLCQTLKNKQVGENKAKTLIYIRNVYKNIKIKIKKEFFKFDLCKK